MENQDTNTKQPNEPLEFTPEEMKMPKDIEADTASQDSQVASESNSPLMFIILVVIAVLLLLSGGYYVWSTMPGDESSPTVDTTEEIEDESQTEKESTLSDSDEIDAIAEDLENTDFAEMEAELDALEAEMDAEFQTQ